MATLFQTSSQIRRIVVFVLLAIILILVVDNVSRFLNSPSNPFAPQISFYLDADTNLGVIPTPQMTSLAIGKDSRPTFTLEGAFPDFPDSGLVYTIERPREKLDTVEGAVAIAAIMGFTGNYASLNSDEISWQNNANTRTLIFNKVTQQWRLRTKYNFDAAALSVKQLNQNLSFYEQIGNNIASRLGFSDRSLLQGKVIPQYALLGPDGLFTHPFDQSTANYVSVDIFRALQFAIPKSLADLPSTVKETDLPPAVTGFVYKIGSLCGTSCGSMHMIISNSGGDLKADLYELDFTNYTYNYTNYSVREIITPDEAWDRIRQNQGALAHLRLDTADYFSLSQSLNVNKFVADATQTEVGYYEPEPWDGYVYPIYIFRGRAETDRGNANFVFFVDAIRR